jgi:hypothetical protein
MNSSYNIFSKQDLENLSEPSQTRIVNYANKIRKVARQYRKINFNNVNGRFDYRAQNDKNQRYIMNIQTNDDAIFFSTLLTNHRRFDVNDIPLPYRKIWRIFDAVVELDDLFIYSFRNELNKIIMPKSRGRGKNKKVKNPVTGRMIKIGSRQHAKIFKNIPMFKVKFEKLHNFNVIDYDINEYCVPSYLTKKLLKREYKIIKDRLEEIKSPTVNQLTPLLNEIDYNLNVYIHDGECIQNQETNKKTINIIIHDSHMYVLKNKNIYVKPKKIIECNDDEFDKIETETHTNLEKLNNGIKYKLKNIYSEIKRTLGMIDTFSDVNINFYNNCGIRACRYIDKTIDNKCGIDINHCYKSILMNSKYSFPIQDGTEIIEVYNDNDRIYDHCFYYCEFNDMDDIEYALFRSFNCWILGYLINNMNLKHKMKIIYKQEITNCRHGMPEIERFNKILVAKYTGCMAITNYENVKTLNCKDKELIAYRKKYNKDITVTKDKIRIYEQFKNKKSGIYSYLAILQYARYQLYILYTTIKKINKDINIHKIYTDSISIDQNIKDVVSEKQINNKLKKYGFSVKYEYSKHKWKSRELIVPVPLPTIIKRKVKVYDNIKKLIKKDISFCINARAGYGKSHTIKNKIIPYLEKHKKKYIITSPTLENAKDYECETVQKILLSKESSIKKLKKKFRNIDYLICDEMTLLKTDSLSMLEKIKKETNIKIILAGDVNQCTFSLCSMVDTHLFRKLTDYNEYHIKWHKYARYDNNYDNFLDKLLTFKNVDNKCISFIKEYFKNNVKDEEDKDKDTNKIKLCYTHKYGSTIKPYMTVHKAQGKTLDIPYSIYEIKRMNIKILYTALSRCKEQKLITIYV